MKITMEGKYAYRGNPTEQVRILCVDRPENYPVVSMSPRGVLHYHPDHLLGESCTNFPKLDLVPLEEKPLEVWVNIYKGHCGGSYLTKKGADISAGQDRIRCALFREVKD